MKLVLKTFLILLCLLSVSCGRHDQKEPFEVAEFRRPRAPEQKQEEPVEKKVLNAVLAGNLVALRELIPEKIAVGAPIDKGETALWLAVENGKIPVVELLLRLGADPNQRSINGVLISDLALQKNERRIYWLLKPEETKQLTHELFQAIVGKKFKPIRAVLEQNFEINFQFEDGDTPLTKVIQSQCIQCLQVILNDAYKADPEFPDSSGRTPLDLAQLTGIETIINFVESAIARKRTREQIGEGS
jgi:ankyrin repeat protein